MSAAPEQIILARQQLPEVIAHLSPVTARAFAPERTEKNVRNASELEHLMLELLFSQLQTLGLFVADQPPLPVWKQQIQFPASYGRWLQESLSVLTAHGYLTAESHSCTRPGVLDGAALWTEWDARKKEWLEDANLGAQVRLVERTLRALPQILSGKQLATDVLFPNSSLDLVQGIYQRNPVADYFNAVLADTVVELVQLRSKHEEGARIRILEIGAGTGGTSEGVFARLRPHAASIAEYCYTDISKAFLLHAQQTFGPTTPYLSCRLLNVEKPVEPQGLELGTYDAVIATNVLHATKQIRHTLRNAKSLLKRNGLLLLNEIADRTVFAHLTFGLLHGWWLHEDAPLRIPGTPALAPEAWRRALKGEGFSPVLFPAQAAHVHGQQIIVAASDGVIRRAAPPSNPTQRARAAVVPKAAQGLGIEAGVPIERVAPAVRGGADQQDGAELCARAADHQDTAELRERAVAALRRLVSETLRTPLDQIDERAPLEKFGVDSLLVVKMTNSLRKFVPEVSSTVLFEYKTVAALAEHLIQNHAAALAVWARVAPRPQRVPASEGGKAAGNSVGPVGNGVTPAGNGVTPAGNGVTPAGDTVRPAGELPGTAPNAATPAGRGEIAIIGLSGRYPQAESLEEFWENLKAGRHCIEEIPADRWDHGGYFDPHKGVPGKTYSKWGGFLRDVDRFDPLFFRISPLEAEQMDPQERLFLQEAYASLEDAGYTASTLSRGGKVGVYVGVMNSTYLRSSSYWSIANRVSYLCGFSGPSMAVDTACSSSLTAIHLAVESIRSGACECAIAGGVSLLVDPVQYTNLAALNMLSSDDKCRSFGDRADGFVDGEGVGAVLLKPLVTAVGDGDHVHAVIKASSVNHGGKTNGYTVPNPVAQRDLVLAALSQAQMDPRAISYVEAHGTGTELGDPIEIAGLTQAFGQHSADKQYCAIGSLKSNIGHLEAAAGIAGLTKLVLQLQHRTLVPSLHSQVLNPHIDFARTPFRVQQSVQEWRRPLIGLPGAQQEFPRIAGISSFGAGGSNAHLIIEEYLPPARVRSGVGISSRSPALIVLSAKNEQRLRARAQQLLAHISARAYVQEDLADIAYTLQVGREAMEQRLAFAVATLGDLQDKLNAYLQAAPGTDDIEGCYRGEARKNSSALSGLNADEDTASLMQTWLEKGKFTKLLDLWVQGLSFDWAKLYGAGSVYGATGPQRIPLPTYPFARERYWINSRAARAAAGDTTASAAESAAEEAFEPLLFAERWHPESVPMADAVPTADAAGSPATVVVFLSDPHCQAQLAAALARVNANARVVFISRSMSAGDALSRIASEQRHIDAVWYLWGLEDRGYVGDQEPIVRLIQGLATAGLKETTVLLAAECASALDRCHVESWIGYERSLKQVLPRVKLAVIHEAEHLDARSAGSSDASTATQDPIERWARWAQRLWNEQQAPVTESALYIAERRHTLRIDPVEVPSGVESVLRAGGTYLITGGMGGLGYLFAQHLAKRYTARLILVGRSSLDAAKESRLRALEALGGQVLYVAADVSVGEQMRAALARGEERFGRVNGVLHAAGVGDRESILNKKIEGVAATLAPKLAGTRVLSELCAERGVDFVCYFSSSAAVLGDFGSCDYAVGNRFELAHAKYVSRRAVAICWPLWAQGGMGLEDDAATQLYLHSSGQRALPAAEGLELFERVLALHRGGVVDHALVMMGQKSRIGRMLGLESAAGVELPACVAPESEQGRPELRGLTLSQCVEWELQELASALLKLPRDRVDAQENLAEFGFDSIRLAELAKRVSKRFAVDITPALFFRHSSLAKLTRYLVDSHGEALRQCYGKSGDVGSRTTGHSRDADSHDTRRNGADRPTQTAPISNEPLDSPRERAPAGSEGPEPIAIIGMSGRFPGARNVDELWETLAAGAEAIQKIPPERFEWRDPSQAHAAEPPVLAAPGGATPDRWLGAIAGVDEFDPSFFEISPKEAGLMDPRQRLLLQESFSALEDAGYAQPDAARIGMFVGVEHGDYQTLLTNGGVEGGVTGTHDAILASRLSYFLNLRGPAMAINTACSSGLVAAHQACLSLRAGESDAAIAAGVNLVLAPSSYALMSHAGMLSSDGRCYAFDRRANGMVPGEAVVAIVLKRLSAAQADGDVIHAVIRGSGINYDGKTNGMTAPGGAAQAELIEDVYRRAGIKPQDIQYIVTHGTGTRLGDPVEIQALQEAFKGAPQADAFCALTSMKGNLGHTFAASGLVSLVGLVQALRHETIPASLHCEQLSDYIDWKRSPFYVNTRNRPWPKRADRARLGAVSAFGMSGTNAHMVVEGYQEPAQASAPRADAPDYLFALSAKTDAALQRRAGELIDVLKDERRAWDAPTLTSLSHTLLACRQHFSHRCALVSADRAQAIALLESFVGGKRHPTLLRGTVARDFVEQTSFRRHGEELIDRLPLQRTDAQSYRESLAALGDLYCQGYSLDWRALHGNRVPRRMSLPPYPFARERHWLRKTPAAEPAARVQPAEPAARVQPAEPAVTAQPAEPPAQAQNERPARITLRPLQPLDEIDAVLVEEGATVKQRRPVRLDREETAPDVAVSKTPSVAAVSETLSVAVSKTPSVVVSKTPARAISKPSAESLERLEEELSMSLAQALYMEVADVERDKPFMEIGLDSIVGVEWVHALNARYGLSLAATKIYDHPTIKALAEFILQHQQAQHGDEDSHGEQSVPAVEAATNAECGAAVEVQLNGKDGVTPVVEASPNETTARGDRAHVAEGPGAAVAIIGISGRYPGASDLDQYWENLAAGRDGVAEIPPSRWDVNEYYDPRPQQPGKTCCKWLGCLEGVEDFDPLFFSISPAEAQRMDPQQRLFLQESYRAFEDAGYDPKGLSNVQCGVYLGIAGNEYGALLERQGAGADTTGNNAAIGAARIAYHLNLKGPAIAIDTACSASLVATHLACQALRAGEIEMALAGGVTLYLTPESYIGMSSAGMLSPQGRCRTFDSAADGFVPGEGVGIVVLKRLGDAQAANDRIHGVIVGSGINQDGRTNGITAPSATSQMQLARGIYARYGIDPAGISYVEMHGTGTKLGDPIELEALSTVFAEHTRKKNYCAIGSVKSNIGHTSAAAGAASMHKVLLSLQHGELVPTLNYRTPNEHFDFEDSPFYVNTERRPWDRQTSQPRRAAVSSFGFSGTNAHVVIEEYVQPVGAEHPADSGEAVIVLLSAKTTAQLRESAQRLRGYVDTHADIRLAQIAYTLQVGREAMECRLAIVTDSKEKLTKSLTAYLAAQPAEGLCTGQVKKANDVSGLLGGDEDAGALLQTWLAKRKLKKLAQSWVRGVDIEWARLYGSEAPQRASLPTYPFAKERCWIAHIESSPRREVSREPVPAAQQDAIDRTERLLSKCWESSPVRGELLELKSVVIVCRQETRNLADTLAGLLSARSAHSRVLVLDEASGAGSAGIDWSGCTGWIDVVGCGSSRAHGVEWIASLQRWVEAGPREGMLALCVTRALEAHQNSTINLSGADRVGLYRMLSSEYSRIVARHVDTDAVSDESALAELIVAECAGPRDEIEVCYRGGQRYRAVLQEIQLPGKEAGQLEQDSSATFPSEQVLWITGGTRGIGYLCAQHFVRKHGVKRLVLTGRDAFPPREQWPQAQLEDTPVGRKIRAVLELESEGAEVQVLSVPLTDEAALRQSIESVKQTLGPIGGVLHCAGMVDGEQPALIRKTLTGLRKVLAPKVTGLDHLVECFAQEPLQFFVLFSSVATAIPALGVGQSDYAMANAYMDYMAHAHAGTLPIMSIQWPSWKEAGMGENRSPLYRRLGFLTHSNAEGLRFLDSLLAHRYRAVVLPAIIDPARWQAAGLLRPRSNELLPGARQSSASPQGTPATQQPPDTALAAVQAWIVESAARELKLDPARIELDTPLPDYGVDSIMLVQLLRPIAARVGEAVDPSILFEYPTIELFSKWLLSRYGEALGAGLGQTDPRVDASSPTPPVPQPVANAAERSLPVALDPSRAGPADIAVVGLSCRFAGAGNVEEFWRLLAEGRTAIRRVPPERWGHKSHYFAGVLDNAALFDPAFFLISPADARAMDPQALLALEESLALWCQAGYSLQEIKGRSIGVYLGARSQVVADAAALKAAQNPSMAVGANYLAANISRFFDLRGPSVVIDTACSSALVAMNMAIQSLHGGEVESALVGGVSMLNGDAALQMFEQRGILSPEPTLHLFDRRASGTILGEGAGMVWLKTLEQALRDGDSIYAVIKGIAINNDGRTAGPAAPNLHAQKAVMERALARSGKRAQDIGHIEVNGSGTEVTDLIELKAIQSVYRSSSTAPCELGSMKPNIGHPLCAEGIASFIKGVLMLHHRQRVPFLSAQEPLNHYDLAASPFRFCRTPGGAPDVPSVAAINCFADGGTNAHVILEAWRGPEQHADVRRPGPTPILRRVDCRAHASPPQGERSIWGEFVSPRPATGLQKRIA